MDLCMIDVTEIEANEGDTVVVFGETPSVIDLAESIGTIPYRDSHFRISSRQNVFI